MKQIFEMNLLISFSYLTIQHIKIYLQSKFEIVNLGETQNDTYFEPGGSKYKLACGYIYK